MRKDERAPANTRTRLLRLSLDAESAVTAHPSRQGLEEIAAEARDLLPRVLGTARVNRPLWLRACAKELPGILSSVESGETEALRFVSWYARASLRLLRPSGRDTPIHTRPSGEKAVPESNQESTVAGQGSVNIQILEPGKPVARGATRRGKRNMRTNASRRWRKNGKRGVSPIIATILLVAITVVLAAVLYILISGLTKGPGNTPLGTAFAFGPTSNISGPASIGCIATHACYSLEIASAGGGITANALTFSLRTSSGAALAFHAGATITLVSISGGTAGTWTASSSSWTLGGTTAIAAGETLVIDNGGVPNAAGLLGDSLLAVGQGSYSGTVSSNALS